jgi:naphthoate synthase
MGYTEITVEVSDGVAVVTINRPDRGNKLTFTTARELYDALRAVRDDPTIDVAILTGAGEKFFCIGGEHEELERLDYSNVMPVVDLYEMIDTMPKPVIAAVNGYAVGGGNVLQVVCDLSVASANAIFRQVGPMVGSFDAGYGTWYLEELVGRRRAKEMWYLNKKYTAQQALEMDLINEVCADGVSALERALEIAAELRRRGPFAIASLKTAFSGRHTGVVGQARLAHDLLLTAYRGGLESNEMSASFEERREPDRDKFYR